MKDYPMTEVIAEREYELVFDDGRREKLRVQLGKPSLSPDTPYPSWYCPWIVERAGTSKQSAAAGEDSVQALLMGISGLRADLRHVTPPGKLMLMERIEGPYMDLV